MDEIVFRKKLKAKGYSDDDVDDCISFAEKNSFGNPELKKFLLEQSEEDLFDLKDIKDEELNIA